MIGTEVEGGPGLVASQLEKRVHLRSLTAQVLTVGFTTDELLRRLAVLCIYPFTPKGADVRFWRGLRVDGVVGAVQGCPAPSTDSGQALDGGPLLAARRNLHPMGRLRWAFGYGRNFRLQGCRSLSRVAAGGARAAHNSRTPRVRRQA